MDNRKKIAAFVFFFFVLTVVVFFSLMFKTIRHGNTKPKPVDHHWFVQLYPPGYCHIASGGCSNPDRAKKRKFSIHGLWPVDSKGKTVAGDSSTAPQAKLADILADQSLAKDMIDLWPTMNGNIVPNDDFTFWKHEWTKHGCADLNFKAAVDYFKLTIGVTKLQGANLTQSFSNKKIYPGQSYPIKDVRDAIEIGTNLKESIVLQCFQGLDNLYYVSEVRFCVDRQGTSFIKCIQKELEEEEKKCGTGDVTFGL